MERDNFFTDLVQLFRDIINCESVSLYVRDESEDILILAAAVGYPESLIGMARYQVGEGLTGWVARSGQLFLTHSPQELMSHPHWKAKYDNLQFGNPRFHSLMAIPLKGKEGKVVGVLKAENKNTADYQFNEADLTAGDFFARTAAIALELQQKNNQLKKFIYAFVLMPFDHSFDDVYKYGIKKPAEDVGITCERVDEIQYVGGVLDQVFKSIEQARFIIADMTGRNPNVFYEVGYCHAIRKDVILCTQSAEDIPFDLRGYNHIVYEGKIGLLEEALRKRILSLIEQEE